MLKEHRTKRCDAGSGCDKYGSMSRMPKGEVPERLAEVNLITRLQLEQERGNKPVRYSVQAKLKSVVVTGRRDGIGASYLLAARFLYNRHKLPWRERQFVRTYDFEFKMVDLGRKLRLAQ
jgi:hypothetical protein